jgi:hypothetical protein
MVTVLTLLTKLIIYDKKYNLNDSNFLLNGKDVKYKFRSSISKLKLIHLL